MKRVLMVVLGMAPIVAGCLLDWTMSCLWLYKILYYSIPVLLLVFWFWAGRWYARQFSGLWAAVLAGNAWGILSAVIFTWQFVLVPAEEQNLFLAFVSQLISIAFLPWTVRLAPRGDVFLSPLIYEYASLLILLAAFTAGSIYERRLATRRMRGV